MGQGVDSIRDGWCLLFICGLGFLAVLISSAAGAGPPLNLSEELQSIEAQSQAGEWREADARLDALEAELAQASTPDRVMAGLIRARHKGIGGREADGLALLATLRDKAPPSDMKLRSYGLSANLAMNLDRHTEGFDYLRRALELLPETGDRRTQAEILGHAGMIYYRLGEFDQAAQYGETAVAIARSLGDDTVLCPELERLTTSHSQTRSAEVRLATVVEAEAACLSSGDELFLAAVVRKRGGLMKDLGLHDQAMLALSEARERMELVSFERGSLTVELDKADLHLAMGEHQEAIELLLPAIDALRARGERGELDRGLRLLASAMELSGDPDAAMASLREAEAIRDELVDRERSMRRDYLKTAFETELHRQELTVLREQARVAELEEQSRAQGRQLTLLGYSLLGLILILLVMQLLRFGRDRRHFRRLSQCDSLTGLLNHSHFFHEAGQALAQSRANEQPFALVLADIDHFKRFNDSHGHAAGDGALRKVASLLREVFGDKAIIGRIGGEEFALALPGWLREEACSRVQRFREALGPLIHEGERLDITLSFGVIMADTDASLERLRRLADDALYQAKAEGRDRVVEVAPSEPSQ